jgi:DNA-binding IclR family transcriptional regulator
MPRKSAPARTELRAGDGIQVIARAAAILRSLETYPGGSSLAEISERVGLARSTVQRIVAALADEGLITGLDEGGRIRLGLGIARLAASARPEFLVAINPHLHALSAKLRETVDLARLVGSEAVFIDQVSVSRRLEVVSTVGDRFPIHCTANGKAFLAGLSDAAVRRLVGPTLKRMTPHTITSVPKLLEELATVRASGIAYDREEHTLGISAVGALLNTQPDFMTAITVVTPAVRFASSENRIAEALLQTTQKLQRELGISA